MAEGVVYLPVEKLSSFRSPFASKGLSKLVKLVKEKGLSVLEPIVVVRLIDDWLILRGYERYEAAKQAGFKKVPCIIRRFKDVKDRIEYILSESLQYGNMSVVERSSLVYLYYRCSGIKLEPEKIAKKLLKPVVEESDELGKKIHKIAERLGKLGSGYSKRNQARLLFIRCLDKEVRDKIAELHYEVGKRKFRPIILDNEVLEKIGIEAANGHYPKDLQLKLFVYLSKVKKVNRKEALEFVSWAYKDTSWTSRVFQNKILRREFLFDLKRLTNGHYILPEETVKEVSEWIAQNLVLSRDSRIQNFLENINFEERVELVESIAKELMWMLPEACRKLNKKPRGGRSILEDDT